MESTETRLPARRCAAFGKWLMRGCARAPVHAWLATHAPGLDRRARRNFARLYGGDVDARRTIDAWAALPAGVAPRARARDLAVLFHRDHSVISRELAALRAVQSLSVLDVRNYRQLVFRIGDYAADGEASELADALP
jgi:hypothetical protein